MAERYPISTTDSKARTLKEIWEETSKMEQVPDELIEEIYKAEIENLEPIIGETETGVGGPKTILRKIWRKSRITDFSQEVLHKPICVCVSEKHKTVFVSVSGDPSIAMLDLIEGSLICKLTSCDLKSPWGLAVKDDTLYVTDIENIGVITFSIAQRTRINELIRSDFKRPRQLAINSANEVWVADDEGEVIVVLDERLCLIDKVGENMDIQSPIDIKFSCANAYILSQDKDRMAIVHKFDQNTREYLRLIIQSTQEYPIHSYSFVITSNIILILNGYSNSILVYYLSGKKIDEFNIKDKGVTAMPLFLDIGTNQIFILYPKLDKSQLKILSLSN